MPGILQRGTQFGYAAAISCSTFSGSAGSLPVSDTVWSRKREDVSFDQLWKFWGELPTQARRELLRIDKQTLCEQARKNLYCSRCHGLLLECYSQILIYGKSLQQEFVGGFVTQKTSEVLADYEYDNLQDPSVHPWGGLVTTKDGMLTLLDCFTCASSPDVIHKVFSSARQKEHDRELLYPDACGGGGCGWISQGLANYGRIHGTRETCALHTSRLSCDTLLDFWSALGDETRSSLLHMKEEDFIERLMYRFDNKRFCRDCRRNVLREFKELKELKRLRKELYCTSWFCAADTSILYEVCEDSVVVDWRHSFTDTSTYHHFEWGVGTAEGKDDILDFEDVGMNGKVEVVGLDLSGLSACFITLRAWKLDGRCNELSVKAHALNGQACVHGRLTIGDGLVTITKGVGIKSFFEHAEEVEEEEDDDSIDKDGIELDGDGSRPQKHAKSPELAREFLLDAATVIFKEQVEKAFREGTARQNSHSLFVSLAIKLLEDCVHVACKEIITLEKQIKLLEEEENEKRVEEERRERKRNKERGKKLRRKERIKEKEKDREMKLIEAKPLCIDLSTSANSSLTAINHESQDSTPNPGGTLTDLRNKKTLVESNFSDMADNISIYEYVDTASLQSDSQGSNFQETSSSLLLDQSKSSRRKLLYKRVTLQDPASKRYDKHRSAFSSVMNIQQESSVKAKSSSMCLTGGRRVFRERVGRVDSRHCIGVRIDEKFRSSHNRIHAVFDSQPCRSPNQGEYRLKDWHPFSTTRGRREVKSSTSPADFAGNLPRQHSRYSKRNHTCYIPDNCVVQKGKLVSGASGRDSNLTRRVWEPTEARKKHSRSNLGSVSSTADKDEKDCHDYKPSSEGSSSDFLRKNNEADSLGSSEDHPDGSRDSCKSFSSRIPNTCQNGFLPSEKDKFTEEQNPPVGMSPFSMTVSCPPIVLSSSSDSCSSCPSEGDSSTSFSSILNVETCSTSDSEDSSQPLDGDIPTSNGDANPKNHPDCTTSQHISTREDSRKVDYSSTGGSSKLKGTPPPQHMIQVHKYLPMPTYPSEIVGYENQNTMSWSGSPIPFPQHSHYIFQPAPGYAPPATICSGFVHYSTLQPPPITALYNVKQHHSHHAINRDSPAHHGSPNGHPKYDVVTREEKMCRSNGHPSIQGTETSHVDNSFSLFHFGGPLVGDAAYGVKLEHVEEHTGHSFKPTESQDNSSNNDNTNNNNNSNNNNNNISCSMEETKVEEYSLFATKNSSRFLFSSFTL